MINKRTVFKTGNTTEFSIGISNIQEVLRIVSILFAMFTFAPNSFAQYAAHTQINLPEGAIARLGKDRITDIAYSPDGRRLAVGDYAGNCWMYDTKNGEELALLTGHTFAVSSVSFSPDGQMLASGSYDNTNTVRLWDVSTGAHLQTLEGHAARINSVLFSPDGRVLASGSYDNTVRLWDVQTGKLLQTLEGHKFEVSSVSFSPDGQMLASGSDTVRLWDVQTGKLLQTLEGHAVRILSVSFSPDGQMLASGSYGDTVRLWDVQTGKLLQTLEGHTSAVSSVSFSPDGQMLASGSDTVRLWDVQAGKLLQVLEGHTDVHSVVFSPDGRTIASASGFTVRLWNADTGRVARTLMESIGNINSVVFSPDGQVLASGSYDNTVRLWDVATGENIRTLTGHTSSVNSVTFSPNGAFLASAGHWGDNTVRLWDVATGENIRILRGHTDLILSVSFSPDGAILASGSRGEIRLWDVAIGKSLKMTTGDTDLVRNLAFSPDGRTLAAVYPFSINLWDVSTGKNIKAFSKDISSSNVSFSPDGETLASGSDDHIEMWNVSTGESIRILRGHTDTVKSVSFSPDGAILASGGGDGTVRLWDANTGENIKTLIGHVAFALSDSGIFEYEYDVNSVSFSPNGNMLASGSDDDSVLLWSLTPFSSTDTTVSISPSPVLSPAIGSQFTLSLDIANGKNVAGYQASLKFDATALRYVESASGDYLPSNAFFVPPIVSGDTVTLGATTIGAVSSGNGTLATLTFEVLAVKASTFPLFDVVLTNSEGEVLQVYTYFGRIVVPETRKSSAVVSITPATVLSPAIGEQLIFNFNIVSGQNVKDFQLTLNYDRSALKHISSIPGTYLVDGVGSGDGTLETVTFEVLEVKASTVSLSGHLIATDGLLYVPTFESAKVIVPLFGDVNRDGSVNILDLVQVASRFGQRVSGDPADVNEDGIVNIVDLVKVAGALGGDAAAPSAWSFDLANTFTREQVQQWLSEAQQFDLTDATAQRGILYLKQLLAALTPKETVLLPNYPNPFNPETWIPYQLAKAADVTVTIYAVDGSLVRTLALGHQPIGIYQDKTRAAYWDGKNALGEPVASGVYFYTLTAGEFTATRKMLIRK